MPFDGKPSCATLNGRPQLATRCAMLSLAIRNAMLSLAIRNAVLPHATPCGAPLYALRNARPLRALPCGPTQDAPLVGCEQPRPDAAQRSSATPDWPVVA
jgi:hypothetical protein